MRLSKRPDVRRADDLGCLGGVNNFPIWQFVYEGYPSATPPDVGMNIMGGDGEDREAKKYGYIIYFLYKQYFPV